MSLTVHQQIKLDQDLRDLNLESNKELRTYLESKFGDYEQKIRDLKTNNEWSRQEDSM